MSLENLIFRCLERFWATRYKPRVGEVTSYDPKKHASKVKIKPSDVETGWAPIHTLHAGNGWGILVGLTPGDQVEVVHQEGDFEVAAITKRLHNEEDKPPEVQSGEILVKHKEAGQVYFDKDKNITWTGANGQVIQTNKDGDTTLKLKLNKDEQSGQKKHPIFTIDVNDGDHSIVIDPEKGIRHKSKTEVHVEAPKIHHKGDMKVEGSLQATGIIKSDQGIKAPTIDGTPGSVGDGQFSVQFND